MKHKSKLRMEKFTKSHRKTTEKILVSEGNIVILEYDEKYRPNVEVFRGN